MQTVTIFLFLLCFISHLCLGQSGNWLQQGNTFQGADDDDRTGIAGSMSENGRIIAISTPGPIYSIGPPPVMGYVRVLEWNGTNWTQMGDSIAGDSVGDGTGHGVDLSADGKTIALGSDRAFNASGAHAGQVRIFTWQGNAWIRKGLKINGKIPYDGSGRVLALSADGNTVVISSTKNNNDTGLFRVYEWDGSAWQKKGRDVVGRSIITYFGYSLDIDATGNTIIVSAPGFQRNGRSVGNVRVYKWNGSNWILKGTDLYGEAEGIGFGESVSINNNGDIIAISVFARYLGSIPYAGQVRVYQWKNNNWSPMGNRINGRSSNDLLGYRLKLNPDGNHIALTAPRSSLSGYVRGQVRVYKWTGSQWIQKGLDIPGTIDNDRFGDGMVAISADGNKVISAASRPQNGRRTYVRVHSICGDDCGKDEFEYNDHFLAAVPLPFIGIRRNANIFPIEDEDWYTIEVSSSKPHLRINLLDPPADYNMMVYDQAASIIDSSTNSGTTAEQLTLNNLTSGTYYIRIYGDNGANSKEGYTLKARTRSTAFNPSIRLTTHIEEDTPNTFSLYPNPTKDGVYIASSTTNTPTHWTLKTPEGKVLKQGSFTRETQYISLAGIPTGYYFIEVYANERRYIQKLIIE